MRIQGQGEGSFGAVLDAEARAFRHGLDVNVPVYSDGAVRVISDERIPREEGEALARRIEAAYQYDARRQRWPDEAPLDAPLTVAVLSAGGFARFTGDRSGSVGGVTTGPDLFVLPDRVLGRADAMDEQVIAHELSHVQDFRQGGPRVEQVPVYLQEGKAYLLGESYPATRQLANPHLAYVAEALGEIRAEDAERMIRRFRTGEDEARSGAFGFIGETAGALFIEFMRVRMGKKDAVAQVAEVISAVGQGERYEVAFKRQFGVAPRQVEEAFVEFIAATEGSPEERLAGTLFAG